MKMLQRLITRNPFYLGRTFPVYPIPGNSLISSNEHPAWRLCQPNFYSFKALCVAHPNNQAVRLQANKDSQRSNKENTEKKLKREETRFDNFRLKITSSNVSFYHPNLPRSLNFPSKMSRLTNSDSTQSSQLSYKEQIEESLKKGKICLIGFKATNDSRIPVRQSRLLKANDLQ